jgi:hypothetical protein
LQVGGVCLWLAGCTAAINLTLTLNVALLPPPSLALLLLLLQTVLDRALSFTVLPDRFEVVREKAAKDFRNMRRVLGVCARGAGGKRGSGRNGDLSAALRGRSCWLPVAA